MAIEEKTQIIQVRDTKLAAALLTVGLPLRKDPPYFKKENADGSTYLVWNFETKTKDGMFTAVELIKAWNKEEEFVEANQNHPFSMAAQAIRNYRKMVEHTHNQKPFVSYKYQNSKQIAWVVKGSDEEENCIERGMVRC